MSTHDHTYYIRLALTEARRSPPKPTNFRVGAVLVDEGNGEVLATGYTLEMPGNTHAEQCALQKYAIQHNVTEDRVGTILPQQAVIYTSMEPCVERLSRNLPCVDRIIRTRDQGNGGIVRVYSCVKEPDTFVKGNSSRTKLENAGIEYIYIPGFEAETLEIAKAGHVHSA